MESGGAEDQVCPRVEGKPGQLNLDKCQTIAEGRPQICACRQQHVPRPINGDHSPARKAFEQFAGQSSRSTPGINRALVAAYFEAIEHSTSPFCLRGRHTMVCGGVPLSWGGWIRSGGQGWKDGWVERVHGSTVCAMNFPPTRLSVVARARSDDEETRRLAIGTLIEAYWKPVYKYLRIKWRLDPDEAADLTQDFFTNTLEKDVLGRYDAERARFRTYLRLCVDGFASNARKAESRLKRGGGFTTVPLDFQSAEGELVKHEPAVAADVDELFYQEWVRALFQHAVEDLRRASESAGRTGMFAVFERYDLVDQAERPTYAGIARDLGVTPATVTNHLAAMRRQFRRHVLDRLRDLTTTEEEFEAEAKRLLGGSS